MQGCRAGTSHVGPGTRHVVTTLVIHAPLLLVTEHVKGLYHLRGQRGLSGLVAGASAAGREKSQHASETAPGAALVCMSMLGMLGSLGLSCIKHGQAAQAVSTMDPFALQSRPLSPA